MNSVHLLGKLGQDPKVFGQSQQIVKLRLGTWSPSKKDPRGETQWHSVTCFDKLADKIQLKKWAKGDTILVEGRIAYGKYKNKEGVEVPTTDIIAFSATRVIEAPSENPADFGTGETPNRKTSYAQAYDDDGTPPF